MKSKFLSILMRATLLQAVAFLSGVAVLTTNPVWAADVTGLVKDIQPGSGGSSPIILTDVNGTLFFVADDGVNGEELWKSDGTPDGTVMVKDIRPGSEGSSLVELTGVNSTLFFIANDGVTGRELWKSDGTPGGTVLVKDIRPGSSSSGVTELTNVNGTLLFVASDGTHGLELWRSNGTAGGTVMVKDITYGSGHSFVGSGFSSYLTNVNGTLFFAARNSYQGYELWRSNGTESGTMLVKDINPGGYSSDSDPSNLVNVNGTLFFAADDGVTGRELWKSDGTTGGTVLVKDIIPGSAGSLDSTANNNMTNVNGTLFFTPTDSPAYGFPGTIGRELWVSDGTPGGTVLVKEIYPGSDDSYPSDLTDVDGTLFFRATDPVNGVQLWKSDGTADGTVMVRVLPGCSPIWLMNFNGTLFFQDRDYLTTGEELWKSDGTAGGTVLVMDINPGTAGSLPYQMTNVNGTLFFGADDGVNGRELWMATSQPPGPTDGSTAGYRYCATPNDPINTFSGELFSRKPRDLDLGGPMPLYFQRYYASYLRRNFIVGDLGSNWRHNFDARLLWRGNTITYVTHDGRVTEFLQDLGTGDWDQLTNTDTPYQLSAEGGQDAKLYDPESDRIYTFDYTTGDPITGKLIRIEDGHGNVHTVTYDLATGQIETVSDGLGRTLTFTYNGDDTPKISAVSDGTRSVSFQYTDPIDTEYLTLVTDALLGVTEYSYKDTSGDADHALMTSTTRPVGNVPYSQTFFDTSTAASGRVATQTDADGNMFSFDYSGLDTTLTGPLGNTRVHTHTATGEFSNRQDQAGLSFSMGSDDTGRRNSLTDRLGNTTTYDYDTPSGDLAAVTDADGATSSFSYTERSFGDITLYDLTTMTFADGTTEELGYDENGNTISHTDQVGNTATATYNAYGQPLTITNVAGGTTAFTYNPDATLASITDSVGNTTTFGYDSLKRSSLTTLADGTTQSVTYNDHDQILTITDGNGNTTTMTYDANGNLHTITDPLGNTTTYTYDGNDRFLTAIGPLGTTSRTYHPLGKIETLTDENGNATTFGYDILGRHISTTDSLGHVWSQTYDAEATLSSITDPLGNTTHFTSDAMGRITQTTTPLGNVFGVTYDTVGRVSTETDPLGNTTTFSRDPLGLLSGIVLPGGGISASYIRDSLGNVTAITDPNGNIWRRGYDSEGRRTSRTDPLNNTVQTTYDHRNNPSVITFPGGMGTLTTDYDANGNPTRSAYSDGTTFNYIYDAKNRLTAADGLTRTYDASGRITGTNGIVVTRDPGGRITSMTLAPGKSVTYTYDANNRLKQVTDWGGGVTTFSYDTAGRLTTITRPNGVNRTNTWDADSRPIGISEGAVSTIALTRDAKGQITAADRDVPLPASFAALTSASHTYDAACQVSEYTYDGLGRLTADGDSTYAWDLASRLTSITEGGATTTFTYDAFGYRMSRTVAGTTRGYVWNQALGLPSVSIETENGVDFRYYVHTPNGELLYSIDAATDVRRFYHFDEMGNTIFLTNDGGTVTDSYVYTPYGILMDSTGAYDNPFTWQGQQGVVDEGDGLYYMRIRYYDAENARFISRDPMLLTDPKEINPYQYATNNPLRYQDPLGLRIDWEYLALIAAKVVETSGYVAGGAAIEPIVTVLATGVVAHKTLDSVIESLKDSKFKIDQAEQIQWTLITQGDLSYEGYYRHLFLFKYVDCDYRSDKAVDRRNEVRRILRIKELYKKGAAILDKWKEEDGSMEFYAQSDHEWGRMPPFEEAEPKHIARALELGFQGNEDWFTKTDFNKKKSWW